MERYKILIADDEYWVRTKLVTLLDWEAFGLTCLPPAKDGAQALEMIRQEHPDILITDINMPFLTGLELLQKAHEEQPDLIAFVVSGYGDFDYVKGSFLSGGINYLLKPVSRMDLEKAVRQALDLIQTREEKRMRELRGASSLLDARFSRLVQGRDLVIPPEAEVFFQKRDLVLMLIKIHNIYAWIQPNGKNFGQAIYETKEDLQALSGMRDKIVFHHIYHNGEYMILCRGNQEQKQALAREICRYFEKFPEVFLTCCLTESCYCLENLPQAYEEAVRRLMSRSLNRKHQILFAGMDSKDFWMDDGMSVETAKLLKYCLQTQNKKDVLGLLQERLPKNDGQGHYRQAYRLIKDICVTLTDFAIGQKKVSSMEMDTLSDHVFRSLENMDFAGVQQGIKDMVDFLIPERQRPADSTREIMHQAAQYIQENYFEDLTLSMLAEKFNMESSYFSKIFRQELGENVILYITQRRMEKAKEYIENTDINLTEVAFLVGYNDYSYFNRVFKKKLGMSPREYRNQVIQKEGQV